MEDELEMKEDPYILQIKNDKIKIKGNQLHQINIQINNDYQMGKQFNQFQKREDANELKHNTFLNPVDTIRIMKDSPYNNQMISEIYASCREISSNTNTLNND